MTDAPARTDRSPLSRRGVLRAAAWSTPVVVAAVAVPFSAASGGTIDASGVALTFTGPQWSSEFRLSGVLRLSQAVPTATTVSATITWQGTGSNSAAQGLYLYKGNVPGGDAGIVGWATTTGAPDDQLHSVFVFQTVIGAGNSQTPVVSSYDGSTANGFMYGAETPNNGSAFWDGVITIRFTALGFADAVLTVPYVQ
ncbi:hypothetical protein [Microbacterium azadirachtae]|uniref:hypothetical protein n=1 Tax=Microbacterium azadirachtae TaxID=582680 RepID=UPI0008800671|nr:hypothetical protein [Microbacterium azadirachtae]SDM14926.1 hypothetical protein SAMN04488593_2747 [Microbacterium azadirachtae]SEG38667.1 hypothetical protein SAMN04488594_2732 [Microbacterium azadirachtae]SEG41671.1 hypothetical protein SAMN04488592_2741 [Microbacterium azadirachtae]